MKNVTESTESIKE